MNEITADPSPREWNLVPKLNSRTPDPQPLRLGDLEDLADALDDLIISKGVVLDEDRLDWLVEFIASTWRGSALVCDHDDTGDQALRSLTPKSSADLTGWTEITCWQAEIVRRADLQVASSRTDVDAPDVFTEWWTSPDPRFRREVPVLREYRDDRGCRHYLALTPEEASDERA